MKKMISVAVASALSHLSGSYNESYVKEKNNPVHASSKNVDKKVRFKSITKKTKQG